MIRLFAHCLGKNLLALLVVSVVLMGLVVTAPKQGFEKPTNAPADQITCVDALYLGLC